MGREDGGVVCSKVTMPERNIFRTMLHLPHAGLRLLMVFTAVSSGRLIKRM